MGSEKFCLRWNDFESNISSAFKDLRDDKDFFDLTLACEDDEKIQAHKVILAACSPFFHHVLRHNPHQPWNWYESICACGLARIHQGRAFSPESKMRGVEGSAKGHQRRIWGSNRNHL